MAIFSSVDPYRRLRQYDELPGVEPEAEPVFPLPEDLSVLSDGDLSAQEEAATALFDDLRSGDLTPDTVAQITEVRDAIMALRTEGQRRSTEVAEAQARLADMDAEVHPPDLAAEPLDADADAEVEVDDGEADEDEVEATVEAEDDEEGAPVPVAASARRRAPIGAVARLAPPPATRPGKDAPTPVTITAAADIPGVRMGQKMDTSLLAEAMHRRAALLDKTGRSSTRAPIATINLPVPLEDTVEMGRDPMPVINRITANKNNLPALTAAGGWCGPLTPLYNLFRLDAADGLVDLPTVRVARAGISVPTPLLLPADLTTLVFLWDDDDDKLDALTGLPTGGTKDCIRIPCPTWVDYTLAAIGVCITHGNLADRSFPELTREYVNMVMNAHQIVASMQKLAVIDTTANGGGAATDGAEVGSATSSIFAVADLNAELFRETYRMPAGATLEVLLPQWTKLVIRADWSARAGVAWESVTDQMIASEWAVRNLRPQYISHYQAISAGTAYPSTLDMLIYAAGSYVWGTGGTLDLGVVRDSTLNATNDFTAAWTEEFGLVAQLGPDATQAQVTLAVDGVTACCSGAVS